MRTLVLSALLVAAATPIAAQPHALGHVAAGLSNLHAISSSGQVTTRALSGFHYAVAMDRDNRAVLAHDFTRGAILRFDPATLAVLGTAYTHPLLSNFGAVQSMAFDSNGSLVIASGIAGSEGIYRFTSPTALSTLITAALAPELADVRDAIVDIDTGEWLVAEASTQSLYRVRRDGVAFTTLATSLGVRYGVTQDVVTGDLYIGTCCGTGSGGQSLGRLPRGQSTPIVFLDHPTLRGGYAPTMDRASAAGRSLVTATWADGATAGADGIWRVDVGTAAVTKLASINVPGFSNTYHVVPAFGRNLQATRIGAGRWSIDASFPGQGNRAYYIVPSLSGTRAGVPLPDGRRIPLNVDGLSAAAINGLLGPLWTGYTGALQNGDATATLDLGPLLPAVVGARIWFGAIVLDAAAPLGIAVIADPFVLVVE